jgi:NADPH:quinone reductase-like Zn-dependent oxidoreductase
VKAIVIEEYGNKNQLEEKEVDLPEMKTDQVLVEMHATSINPIDWKLREGYLKDQLPFEFPIILGWDAAGVIKEVGTKVKNFKVGDSVFARPDTTRFGTYAEYSIVDEHLLAPLPKNLSFEEAASIPLTTLTAWQVLFDAADLQEGEHVLIHAGAGGVGTMAIQLAKMKGAYVTTTASDKNIEFVKSLGADVVINYKEQAFEKELKDVDVVFDTLGGEIQTKSYQVLKEGGRLVSIVQPPNEEEAKKHGVKPVFVWLQPNGSQLAEIGKLLEEGTIKPVIGETFPLTEKGLQQAHELSETHHARGKIVIKIK